MAVSRFDGPIPGANYTSDTKNYPWHRPPEYTNLDKAIEYIGKRLTKPENAFGILTMIEMGLPITNITQTFLMSGIMNGKWTLDFALMLAGPTAHIMVLMAKGYGIKYTLGTEKEPPMMSKAWFDTVTEINKGKAASVGRSVLDNLDDIQDNTTEMFEKGDIKTPTPMKFKGFGATENPMEQEEMLGMQTPSETTGTEGMGL